jgi:hypothetical protein
MTTEDTQEIIQIIDRDVKYVGFGRGAALGCGSNAKCSSQCQKQKLQYWLEGSRSGVPAAFLSGSVHSHGPNLQRFMPLEPKRQRYSLQPYVPTLTHASQ